MPKNRENDAPGPRDEAAGPNSAKQRETEAGIKQKALEVTKAGSPAYVTPPVTTPRHHKLHQTFTEHLSTSISNSALPKEASDSVNVWARD